MEVTTDEIKEIEMGTNRPVPGQSLTNDPDNPAPYEGPPEFTTQDEAINHFFKLFTKEENHESLMDILQSGIAVMTIVDMVLTKSFQDGEINPDLMLLLAEPLAYILIGLSEREGIKAVIVDEPDAADKEGIKAVTDEETTNILRSKFQSIKNPQDNKESPMEDKIKNLPSLMARGEV